MKLSHQLSFSQAEYAGKKKQTRRDRFLAEMEQLVPWERLLAVIAPEFVNANLSMIVATNTTGGMTIFTQPFARFC